MSEVTVRFWAAAREAAGLTEERYPAGSLAEVLTAAAARHGNRLAAILECASFLVDGDPVGKRDRSAVTVGAGAVVEVLPPFAGG
ncbi:MAG: sulfur-carrier protein [Frankiales bacterium]|nr:sulfur-carrier protein [Frankiales bacterium]